MSIKHLNISREILRRKSSSIITQRLRKRTCFELPSFKGDDNIELTNQPDITDKTMKMYRQFEDHTTDGKLDEFEEKNGGIELEGIEDVSDSEFRKRCNDAKHLCRNYTYVFFFLEKISKGIEAASAIFAILVANYELSVKQIAGIAIVMFVITIMDSFGDWGRLREKYAHLHHLFRNLANSKAETRIIDFRKYAVSFGSDELFIDSIILGDSTDS